MPTGDKTPNSFMTALRFAVRLLLYLVASRTRLAAENLALRQPFDSAALHSGQAARRLQEEATTTAAPQPRQALLGPALPHLAELANSPPGRQARYGHSLAEKALPGVLVSQVSPRPAGTTANSSQSCPVHPAHLRGPYFAPPCGRCFEGQATPSTGRTASPSSWRSNSASTIRRPPSASTWSSPLGRGATP